MKKKVVFQVVGMCAGLIAIILGIVMLGEADGNSVWAYTEFGGDFYTYSFKATAQAANNLVFVEQTIRQGFGYLLVFLGVFEICFFGNKFLNNSQKYELNNESCTISDTVENVEENIPTI